MRSFEGKITKGVGGLYTVTNSDGDSIQCKARGVFRKEHLTPCIGDNVLVSDNGTIEQIYERKNILIRPPVANIDYLGIVVSAQKPYADTLMLDKLTVSAYNLKITPFVVINKCDIAEKDGIKHVTDHLNGSNIEYITTNCTTPDGLQSLIDFMHPGVTAFAGQSGVGKTSILSVLLPERELEVGVLSEKLERGKHTTRHVELHDISNGVFIMDTPGFSRYDAEVKDILTLRKLFPEFCRFDNECAFNSCTHSHEPDCAVKAALESGLISKTRYKNYIEISNEIKNRKAIYK